MSFFLKISLISLLIFVAGFGLVKAGTSDLLSEYAWSENIGWLSFNCTDDSSCATVDYGVTFSETTGIFSGYAWSENIGWVSFNESDLTGCPSGTCQAIIATSTNIVSGWGRALSYGDGWDGWLSLSGTDPDYGVTRNTTTQELEGYAWGGDVVGWLSFNCTDDSSCSTTSYAVEVYGGDTTDPSSQIISPASNSWFFDDFSATITDEDLESGLNTDECEYKVIAYDGATEHSSGYLSRTCNADTTISTGAATTSNYCAYEGEEACYVYARSTDKAGNVSVPSESDGSIKKYNIDFTAPVPGKLYDSANPTSSEPIPVDEGSTYTLQSVITDNLKTVSCALFINGAYQSDTVTLTPGCTTSCTASVDHQFVLSGTLNNNYMKCRDAAGNISTSEPTASFYVAGGTAPVITSLTSYSSHCDTPTTQCTSQYSCCMDYTTQTNCCVQFSLSAYDPNDLPLTYSWVFGDTGTSSTEDPYHHYSSADTYSAVATVSNGTESRQSTTSIAVTNPTLSVDLSAIPSFGSAPLNNVDLRDIVTGTMYGTIDYQFDCTNDGTWDATSTSQSVSDYTAVDACSYSAGDYTAKTTVLRGTGNISDTIGITASSTCVYDADVDLNATTTCNSDQGCAHTISCQSDDTWPACPTDECTVNDTQDCGTGGTETCSSSCVWGDCIGTGDCTSDFDCYCSLDSCSSGDYYDYPTYGSCVSYNCDVTTAIGSPCEASISVDDPSCNVPPVCHSLTPSPSSGVGPLDVTLTASTTDDDGYVNWYEFTFGDGTYTTVASTTSGVITHTYAEPATASTTYNAEVKAKDEDNDWSTVNATTSIVVTKNIPPVASLGCDASSCGTGSLCDATGTSIVYNQNCQFSFTNGSTDADSTNTPPNNHISTSTWSIFYSGGTAWYDPYTSYSGTSTMDSLLLPTGMPQSQAYYMYLEVEDVKGATATTSADFYVRREIVSSFQCSLDPGDDKVWKTCNGLNVSEDETVYFKDLSVGSETSGAGTATINSWAWTFTGGTPATSTASSTSASFVQGVTNTGRVLLTVTDDAGRTDSVTHDLVITIPLPEWQEIAPI